MFKENIMKKIAGLSLAAVVMMPGVAKAAVTVAADAAGNAGALCKAENMTDLKSCMKKSTTTDNNNGGTVDTTKVTTIELKGTGTPVVFTIDENLTVTDYALTLEASTTKLVVGSGKTLTLRGKANITGAVEVDRGTLKVNTSSNTAIAGNLTLNSATSTISADNTNNNAASKENTAKAVAGNVTLTKSTLTVSKGDIEGTAGAASTIKLTGVSTLDAKNVKGNVTVDGDGAAVVKATKVDGTLTVNGDRNVTVTADEITGAVAVDNEKANVRFAGDGVAVSVTKGLVRKTNIVSANVSNVDVIAVGLSNVALEKANEVLVVENLGDLGENFKVTGPNGAKIDNQSGTELTITVNGQAVTVSADAKDEDAYVIAGAQDTQEPEKPGDATQNPSGDTTINNNPATGDSIMSYVALAVSSVASLGLAVKKFLF